MTQARFERCDRPAPTAVKVARFAAPLLLLCGITAQSDAGKTPPAARVPQFTLAAGEHDLGALVDLLGQIRKAKIECDLEALDPAARRIHLQQELRLEADAWDDVVTTLLRSRGLVLAPGATDGTKEVVIVGKHTVKALIDGAEPRQPDQVVARPNQIAFVSSFHECKKVNAVVAINMMRPLFASVRDALPALTLAMDGNKIVVVGCTDDVACALRYLRAADGQDAFAGTPSAPRFAAEPESAWPARDLPAAAFLDATAKVLGVNILWQADELATAAPVPAGALRRLGPAAWYVEATRALRQVGLVLVSLDEGHRVFEVVAIRGPRMRGMMQRARPCPAERVLAKDMPVELVWVAFRMQHISAVAATNGLRAHARTLEGLTLGVFEDGLVLWGLSDSVASVLGKLTELDVAPPK